ncbi:DUF6488 family protein [Ketobacter sp.]|uniref:DUF6488 family protein n=1 Tax=Ketobacter sp. TaxID=2083498 RepID=UPI0025C3061C|nr:DUF6488 family protein [Ketobacter sp.]
MKNLVQCIVIALMAMMPVQLMAHANHASFDPVTAEQAEAVAEKTVHNLVSSKQLAESWKSSKKQPVTQRETRYGKVWVVVFTNDSEKAEDKRTLHVFVDEFGNPISANHEGKI